MQFLKKNKICSILVILVFIGVILLVWKKYQTIESLRDINYREERKFYNDSDIDNQREMDYDIETNLTPNLDEVQDAAKIDKTFITTNPCMGDYSLINSEFSVDICKEYGDNYTDLNEKCKKLSGENCILTDCCVLIDGEHCRAGSNTGPNFKTENGIDIDYDFYLHKSKCYGSCNEDTDDSDALSQCMKYSDNSTNISTDCMMQMFNKYACQANIRNPAESFVTPEFAEKFKDLSMKQLRDGFKDTCSDYYRECEKYDDDGTMISNECVIQILNRLGCPNPNPDISGSFIESKTTKSKTKKEIKILLTEWVSYLHEMIKKKSAPHEKFCYGT